MQVPAFDTGELDHTHTLWCQATDASDTPQTASDVTINVYDDSDKEALSLSLASSTVSGVTGLLYVAVDLTGANGFERGKSYLVRWSATVSAATRVGTGRLHVT